LLHPCCKDLPTRSNVAASTERLLTVSEVAERLGVSAFTVYNLCDRRELAHVRVSNAIRIPPDSLRGFIAGQS